MGKVHSLLLLFVNFMKNEKLAESIEALENLLASLKAAVAEPEINKNNPFKVTEEDVTVLPAGKYWVGDPCYLIRQDDWSYFCEVIISLDFEYFSYKNLTKFFYFNTYYGDGVYPLTKSSKEIAELGVDSGTLAIIPAGLAKEWAKHPDAKKQLGRFITVDKPFSVDYDNGIASFGDYVIDTYGEKEEIGPGYY